MKDTEERERMKKQEERTGGSREKEAKRKTENTKGVTEK